MTVLGWTLTGRDIPANCKGLRQHAVDLILSRSMLPSARARALAQIALARTCDAFLPATPQQPIEEWLALNWTKRHHDRLVTWLTAMRGSIQVSAQVTLTPPLTPDMPTATWLRNRAGRRAANVCHRRYVSSLLNDICVGIPVRATRQRELRDAIALDLLLPVDAAENVTHLLRSALTAAGKTGSVVGPLPIYGFTDLGGYNAR